MYTTITQCRVCGNARLESVIDLGIQALTGVFPRPTEPAVESGPLELVRCVGTGACGLVQLRQTFQPEQLYGQNYGYRSGLNRGMVEHLKTKAQWLQARFPVGPGDVVLDIGSNDGTTLSFYPENGPMLVGIDPSAEKFRKYYRSDVRLNVDFFTADAFREMCGDRRAKIITSIAMFYDLEDPQSFVNDIAAVLDDDGVWHFEQSYLPLMLEATAYDTICHEHSEYYALAQVLYMLDRAGLRVLRVTTNDVNGGSFAVTAAKRDGKLEAVDDSVEQMVAHERAIGLTSAGIYEAFAGRVRRHPEKLRAAIKAAGKNVLGYGASTKGNVMLQYCGLTADDIPAIAEVNEDKFGCVTPGTCIPIISESEARARRPDCFVVLPWHFRSGVVKREQAFLAEGGMLLFPLPEIETVRA